MILDFFFVLYNLESVFESLNTIIRKRVKYDVLWK